MKTMAKTATKTPDDDDNDDDDDHHHDDGHGDDDDDDHHHDDGGGGGDDGTPVIQSKCNKFIITNRVQCRSAVASPPPPWICCHPQSGTKTGKDRYRFPTLVSACLAATADAYPLITVEESKTLTCVELKWLQ